MPTIFQVFDLRFFIFAEDHSPIHVHIVKCDDDAKVAIEPDIELVYNHGLEAKDLKRALNLARCTRMISLKQ